MRLNKKKKSTNISPYPDEVIDRLARAFYPAILACWNSEEGQREFAAWQAEQAHHANNEKQEVPVGRVPIKQYLQKFPQWGRFSVTSVTLFLLLPVHPEGCTPARRT
ncbi:transposase [Faecalibacterium prausnitzii]